MGDMLPSMGGGSSGQRYQSHGPAIHGYGPISFGMKRNQAYAALQGKGQFERIKGGSEQVLTYIDYIDYLDVRVVQYFDGSDKATRAEVFVRGAEQQSKTLNECRGFYNTVYGMLRQRYGHPDWDPKRESRRYGESGVMMYTFSDSSNITLSYDHVTRDSDYGLCTVKLTFNPPWV